MRLLLPMLLLVCLLPTACKKEQQNAIPENGTGGIDFTWTENPKVNTGIRFTPSVTNAKTYYWDFGDGTTGSVAEPVHVYSNKGIYKVSLTVITAEDIELDSRKDVLVDIPPIFSFNGFNRLPGDSISFYPDIPLSINAVKFHWNFGDGTTSSLSNPYHAYTKDGRYNITLNVNDTINFKGSPDSYIDIIKDPVYTYKLAGTRTCRMSVRKVYQSGNKPDSIYNLPGYDLTLLQFDKITIDIPEGSTYFRGRYYYKQEMSKGNVLVYKGPGIIYYDHVVDTMFIQHIDYGSKGYPQTTYITGRNP